jgi:hypothetical protein
MNSGIPAQLLWPGLRGQNRREKGLAARCSSNCKRNAAIAAAYTSYPDVEFTKRTSLSWRGLFAFPKQKDRLAAVFLKSDQVFCPGGYDCGSRLPFFAPANGRSDWFGR